MSLKEDFIEAEVKSLKASGIPEEDIDTSPGKPIEIKAEGYTQAIINLLSQAKWRVTSLKANVTLENFQLPDQDVWVSTDALAADQKPVSDQLFSLWSATGNTGARTLMDAMDIEIKKRLAQVSTAHIEATAKSINTNSMKGVPAGAIVPKPRATIATGLKGDGFATIGPNRDDGQEIFDVDEEDGQREFTAVEFFEEENDKLLR